MLLQRLATGATGVKQARYRRGPTRGSEALVRACAVYTACAIVFAVQCAETTHGVYEFRRGFCTIVLIVLYKHARLQRSLWLSQQCYLHFVPRVLHFSAIHCSPVVAHIKGAYKEISSVYIG